MDSAIGIPNLPMAPGMIPRAKRSVDNQTRRMKKSESAQSADEMDYFNVYKHWNCINVYKY